MSSQKVFYIQVAVVLVCLVCGMTESNSWCAWASYPIRLLPLSLCNAFVVILFYSGCVFPFVIRFLAIKEGRSRLRSAAAVALSVVLGIASVVALLPAFQ